MADPIDFSAMFNASRLADVALRTCLIYFGLLLALRIAGKREVGQMKPFDLVTLLIISNAVQNAMVGPDNSLVGGMTAAGIILLLNRLVGFLRTRYGLAGQVFEGSPTVIAMDGKLMVDKLENEGLSEADVVQAMRERGVEDLAEVKTAVLEVDGSISIIQKEQAVVKRTRRHFRRKPGP
ncbi:MAG TPA: YetF domain-containing protein [Gemmataceae bacterium]|jgi:uncharacterized membrane protein YcaP (DUF421 family)|nr:YetF domain-containing protein [Gemmataceae bacterium]